MMPHLTNLFPQVLYEKISLLQQLVPTQKHRLSCEHFLAMKPCPYLQAIISTASQKIVGAEVLLRFQDKDGNCSSAGEFIELLEKSKHINDITLFLLDEVFRHFRSVRHLPTDFFFTFNICATQLTWKPLTERLLSYDTDFNIVLELVERSTFPHDDSTATAINGLVEQGVMFAIDDFSAGHTSLKYLESMNLTFLKIDQDLTTCREGELRYKNTLTGLLALARELDISLIAEGVESEEQAKLLSEKGIPLLQGYHYCRPMEISDFIEKYLIR